MKLYQQHQQLLVTSQENNKLASNQQQAVSGQLEALLSQLVPLARQQTATVNTQLSALQRSMLDCLPLRFLDWLLSQNDKFYDDPSGLFASLFKHEIGLGAEQVQQLLLLRRDRARSSCNGSNASPIVEEDMKPVDRARRLDEAYNQLCVLLRQQLTEGESYWSMLQALMSPEQFARFLQWTHTYGPVCIKINTF